MQTSVVDDDAHEGDAQHELQAAVAVLGLEEKTSRHGIHLLVADVDVGAVEYRREPVNMS